MCKNDNSAGLYFLVMSPDPYFYAPNFGEVEGGHIGLGLSVRPSVRYTLASEILKNRLC